MKISSSLCAFFFIVYPMHTYTIQTNIPKEPATCCWNSFKSSTISAVIQQSLHPSRINSSAQKMKTKNIRNVKTSKKNIKCDTAKSFSIVNTNLVESKELDNDKKKLPVHFSMILAASQKESLIHINTKYLVDTWYLKEENSASLYSICGAINSNFLSINRLNEQQRNNFFYFFKILCLHIARQTNNTISKEQCQALAEFVATYSVLYGFKNTSPLEFNDYVNNFYFKTSIEGITEELYKAVSPTTGYGLNENIKIAAILAWPLAFLRQDFYL